MATGAKPSVLRGLLIPSPAHTYANMDLTSPPTQAGPLPGVPEDTSSTRSKMVLQSSGTQSANKELRLKTVRGGFPGVHRQGGGFIWKEEADTYWRGRDVPGSIAHSRVVGSTTSSYGFRYPNVIAIPNGELVCAYAGGTSTTRTVVVRTRGTSNTWNSATTVHSETSAGSGATGGWLHPCLVRLPDERILLFHITHDTENSTAHLSCYMSADDGDSWSRLSTSVVEGGLGINTTNMRRIRAAYSNGQICLLIWAHDTGGPTNYIYQYASSDFGGSFTLIRNWNTAGDAGLGPDVVASPTGDGFIVGITSGSDYEPAFARIANAYEPVILSEMTDYSMLEQTGVAAYAEGSLVVGDDGLVYWFLSYWPSTTYSGTTTYGGCFVLRSRDQGASWEELTYGETLDAFIDSDSGTWWMCPELATWPREYHGCFSRGQVVLLHNWETNGSGDQSLHETTLGGNSTITMPRLYGALADNRLAWWRLNWLPYDEPDDMGWTLSTTGTPSESVSNGNYYRVTTNGSSTLTQTYSLPFSSSGAMLFRFRAYASTGSYTVKVATNTGTNPYQFEVTRTGTSLIAENTGSGGTYTLGSTSSLPSGSVSVDIKVAVNEDQVSVYWRSCASPATITDREWTVLCESAALQASLDDGEYVKMHTPASSTVSWEEFHLSFGGPSGLGSGYDLATNGIDADELYPINFSRHPVYVDDGVSVAAIDGPTVYGETWSIDTRYEHGVENLDPRISPSPRVTWRATGTAEENLTWTFADDEHYLGSTTWALHLGNVNSRYFTVSTMLAGSVEEEVATIDAAAGQSSLQYVRRGDAIVVDLTGSDAATRYWPENSLVGCTVDLGSSKFRKVSRNTEGIWTDNATKRPTLWLEGVDGTEPTTGTCAVWARDLTWIWHSAFGKYDGLRVTVESGSNADGYHEIGVCTVGPLAVFGQEYSWGRGLETRPNVALLTRRGGSRSSSVLGPARRLVDFGWREGVDTSAVMGSAPEPDYVYATDSTGATTYDFEDGQVPSGWLAFGDLPWEATSAQAHGGTYSLRAGPITHSQDSTATWSETLPLGGTVTFWYKVSSEASFDYFKFRIAGVEQVSASGTVDWTQAGPFELPPGQTSLELAYEKDGSANSGDDTAYVDDLVVTPYVDKALAVAASTPLLLDGIITGIDGPHLPIVYLPRVVTSADEITLNQRDDHLYGRIIDAARREVVVGDELESEVQRISTIAIEEEL